MIVKFLGRLVHPRAVVVTLTVAVTGVLLLLIAVN